MVYLFQDCGIYYGCYKLFFVVDWFGEGVCDSVCFDRDRGNFFVSEIFFELVVVDWCDGLLVGD